MDPIATIVRLSGEDAFLISPATAVGYDPTKAADYAPDDPTRTKVRGVPDRRVDRLPEGAKAMFTFSATSKPPALQPIGSKLDWRGTVWTVMQFRERFWGGRISGYQLVLGA